MSISGTTAVQLPNARVQPDLRTTLASIDIAQVAQHVAPEFATKHGNLLAAGEAVLDAAVRGGAPASASSAATTPGAYPGVPDEDGAQLAAERAIAQIDWSRPRVGLWVPGTTNHGVDARFAESLGSETSTVAVDYPASYDLVNGVSTGMRITELIATEAKRRGKEVVLGGHSQGAWVAGEVMANPAMSPLIDKAVLYGRPAAANARFDAQDPKVRDIANADDPFATMTPDASGFRSLSDLLTGNGGLDALKGVGRALFDNPQIVAHALTGGQRPDGTNPHAYDHGSEAAWLVS